MPTQFPSNPTLNQTYNGYQWNGEAWKLIDNFAERAQDAVATLFTHSSHNNVTATYDDDNNKIIFTVGATLTQEQIQDFVSPLLAHSSHTNLTATYDDDNNKFILQAIIPPSKAVMSASAPASPEDGTFWFDTDENRSGTVKALKVWNALGSTWEYVSSDLSVSTTNTWTAKNTFNQGVIIGLPSAPSSPTEGQVYYDTTVDTLRIWNGIQWTTVTGGGGGGSAFSLISTDTTQVPTIMFFGAAAPTGNQQNVGDLWVDIDDDAGDTEFIFVGPEAPASYGQGTLWVDTDEPELPLIYSDEEPPTYTPTEGDFWVDIDDLSGQLVVVGENQPTFEEAQLWVDTTTEEGLETFNISDVYEGNRSVYLNFGELPDAKTHGGMIAWVEGTQKLYLAVNNIPSPTTGQTYSVTYSNNKYFINGQEQPSLILERGKIYNFSINTPGQPFYIKQYQVGGTAGGWPYGISNNGIASGTLTFSVPYNAPDNMYYISSVGGSAISGSISVTGIVDILGSWQQIYPNAEKMTKLEGLGYMGLLG